MKTKLLYIKANSGSIIITWSKKVHQNLYFFISNFTTKTQFSLLWEFRWGSYFIAIVPCLFTFGFNMDTLDYLSGLMSRFFFWLQVRLITPTNCWWSVTSGNWILASSNSAVPLVRGLLGKWWLVTMRTKE